MNDYSQRARALPPFNVSGAQVDLAAFRLEGTTPDGDRFDVSFPVAIE